MDEKLLHLQGGLHRISSLPRRKKNALQNSLRNCARRPFRYRPTQDMADTMSGSMSLARILCTFSVIVGIGATVPIGDAWIAQAVLEDLHANGIATQPKLDPTKGMFSANRQLADVTHLDAEMTTRMPSLRWIHRLSHLRVLNLHGTMISDLTPLASLTELQQLKLSKCYYVTSIEPLRECTSLEVIYLRETSVSDVSALARLPNLKKIYGLKQIVAESSERSGEGKQPRANPTR